MQDLRVGVTSRTVKVNTGYIMRRGFQKAIFVDIIFYNLSIFLFSHPLFALFLLFIKFNSQEIKLCLENQKIMQENVILVPPLKNVICVKKKATKSAPQVNKEKETCKCGYKEVRQFANKRIELLTATGAISPTLKLLETTDVKRAYATALGESVANKFRGTRLIDTISEYDKNLPPGVDAASFAVALNDVIIYTISIVIKNILLVFGF